MNNATSAHLPDSVMRSTEAESETFIPEIPEFSPSDALPEGTWSLEASAGTGKTHTIAALVSRYLAQGLVDTAGLAVVTFSRSAATVLAERIRARLRQSLNLLAAEPDVINAALTDEFDHAMLACNAAEKKVRENRLRTALAQWDAAQIGTIHEFCEVMLSELGILADSDLSARLVSDLSGLHHQVVSDVYLHRYAHLDRVGFDLKKATELAQAALRVPDALIVPDSGNSDIEERKAFVNNVRAELARRKQLLGIYDHNDQMLRLLQAISGENATAARARLQNKYRVILVDEFQDTDPTQWQILHSCFHGFATMILIGDPKQAIYSFRGADIATYVSATKAASQQRSLRVNYRADAQVISGLNTLFQNLALGEGIAVPQVKASQTQARIRNGGCAVQLRYSTRVLMRVEAARAEITDDLVRQVKLLLAQAQVHQGHWRELRCSDIAILVRSNVYGRNIAQTLSEADIPVAFTGVDSVFDSHPAREWLVLLRALVQPNVNNQRKALMTDFIAASLLDIANASAQQQANWSKQLTDWSTLLSNDGIAALFSRIQTNTSFVEQLASRKLGERDLSDHRHIAQILHAQFEAGIRGLALISWLSEAITSGENNAEWAKKLPTDRDAVQVMTIHRAKGMQFPVVLLPQAADFLLPEPNDAPITTHAVTGERIVDVGGKFGEYRAERFEKMQAETASDSLRSLYVAATRAQSHLVLWWASTRKNTAGSALHRLLFRNPHSHEVPNLEYPLTQVPANIHPNELSWLKAGVCVTAIDSTLCSHGCTKEHLIPTPSRAPATPELRLAEFSRSIDSIWRHTSYSGLTAEAHAGFDAESEPHDSHLETPVLNSILSARSPMADLPAGTHFGTLVHDVFENVDWYTADDDELLQRLTAACTKAANRSELDIPPQELSQALLPALRTPLGEITNGLSLSQIALTDRLSEMNFELPLGDTSTTTLAQVASLLRKWLPHDHLLSEYPARLEAISKPESALRGYLGGSIDSVLRVNGRYLIVDYKTNTLTREDLLLGHFTQAAMAKEMITAHYPLQALLYCVALHRFLTNRLPGYDLDQHFAGVGYLFVRGMAGTPAVLDGGLPTGVFAWRPASGLLREVSELLEGSGCP